MPKEIQKDLNVIYMVTVNQYKKGRIEQVEEPKVFKSYEKAIAYKIKMVCKYFWQTFELANDPEDIIINYPDQIEYGNGKYKIKDEKSTKILDIYKELYDECSNDYKFAIRCIEYKVEE